MAERSQSKSEELANSVSHGVALLAAIAGAPFLIASASHFDAANIVGSRRQHTEVRTGYPLDQRVAANHRIVNWREFLEAHRISRRI